jgi:hypothetical protein
MATCQLVEESRLVLLTLHLVLFPGTIRPQVCIMLYALTNQLLPLKSQWQWLEEDDGKNTEIC